MRGSRSRLLIWEMVSERIHLFLSICKDKRLLGWVFLKLKLLSRLYKRFRSFYWADLLCFEFLAFSRGYASVSPSIRIALMHDRTPDTDALLFSSTSSFQTYLSTLGLLTQPLPIIHLSLVSSLPS